MATKANDRRPAGFTLVELLLVLALVVLLAALAAPSLSGTLARVRLDSAAEQVRTAWTDARLEAIRAGEPVAFQCKIGTGEYTVSTLANATQALAGSTEAAEGGKLADDDYEDLGVVQFVQVSLGAASDTATAADAATEPATEAACLVFRADGATDDAIAVIQDQRGVQRRIVLRGLTCAATIDDMSVEEP